MEINKHHVNIVAIANRSLKRQLDKGKWKVKEKLTFNDLFFLFQVGSLAGAAHLLNCNTGVLR